ncbi:putative ABC transport system permease protein [Bacteroides zoogleoformans]|uniref:ABC transporter permease n=1 Tax=Bacteroides zoogleoformans TaxID=28119 RepID=A0ABM6T5B8_9BACE|nr:FtsX-like permease family protein [Bacteroides zoogleoformans]AVM51901.1 ABC transporter permease [Bacteroides zoogleoformans]TWJ17003.1 putative ABC transport system permease protein [Bacteroides zoogleoformans]
MRYLYYTFQTLLRGYGANAVKIVSLSLGLLMSVFLFARIAFELNFDNFYKEADNLYWVKTGWLKDGVPDGGESFYTLIPIPGVIAEEFPDRVQGATVSCSLFGDRYRLGNRNLEMQTVLADTSYFFVLGLDVVKGNPQDLANPDALFLSEAAARRVFGSEDPIGKTLMYDLWGNGVALLVKGIFKDVPMNTSLGKRPEAIVSFSGIGKYAKWRLGWQSGGNYDGFVRLRASQDAEWLNERLSAAIVRHLPADSDLELSVHITPIRYVHLDDTQVRKTIWIMFFLGIVLLFTTTLNYVLISISSLTQRAKAIGVHKCSGASGGNIFGMFLMETAVMVSISLLVAGVLVYLFHEQMEELAAVPIDVLFSPQHLYAPLAVPVVLFLLGGCLPAVLFARIPVTQVFVRYTSGRRGWKRGLLFVQFTGAAFILGMLLLVFSQYRHMVGRNRGWNPRRVAYIYQHKVDGAQLRTQLRNLPYVEAVASAERSMLGFGANRPIFDNQGNEMFYPRNSWFNSDYLPFIGLRLKEGHNLTGEHQLLVNGKFCEKMHWTDSPIGKQVNDYGRVVGLLDSFAFPGTPNDDVPVMIEWISGVGFCMEVRLKEPFDENLRKLNEEMKHLYPQDELIFLSIEQTIRENATSVRIFRNVTLWASVTILFIVIMGLIGYANDEIRLRSKEIAIRKVNGAGPRDILRLLWQEVLWIAAPSVALGISGAYKAGQVWIGRFKDMVPLPVAGYIMVGLLLLAFIVGCVLLKSWSIAKENPVKSIRNE